MHESARAAIEVVRERARATAPKDLARLRALVPGTGAHTVQGLALALRRDTRLTLNFHPDRRTSTGETVAAGLSRTGSYLPQHRTGLSNGSRSALPGGERTAFESALFGNAYEALTMDDTLLGPVYGALDLTNDPFGGAPRFGSCFIVLEPHCFDRTTFCVGDSHLAPADVGTIDSFAAVCAGMLEQGLIDTVEVPVPASTPARDLDRYIEIQVHGETLLDRDVAAIVADPAFQNSQIHADLRAAAEAYDFALSWHEGSVLGINEVPADFRGDTMPALAQQIATDGLLDAADIGRSLKTVRLPPLSVTGDPTDGPMQQHKYLWHCLLHFGRPGSASV